MEHVYILQKRSFNDYYEYVVKKVFRSLEDAKNEPSNVYSWFRYNDTDTHWHADSGEYRIIQRELL